MIADFLAEKRTAAHAIAGARLVPFSRLGQRDTGAGPTPRRFSCARCRQISARAKIARRGHYSRCTVDEMLDGEYR